MSDARNTENNENGISWDKSITFIAVFLRIISKNLNQKKLKVADLTLKENEARKYKFNSFVRIETKLRAFNTNTFVSNYK